MLIFSRRSLFLFAALSSALVLHAPANAMDKLEGTILLTVTGEISNPNRGAFDPAADKFFEYNEVEFSKATEFDLDALTALEVVKVNADFPKGGSVHEFEGPLLTDVLAAAGASGQTIRLQALDGYAIETSLSDLDSQGAVLALKRDGKALSIGGFGPLQVVFPRADRDDLSAMPDDNWIWSVFHIAVE